MTHRIRIGGVVDAEAVARLAERTFRETFAADNTPENMDAYVAGSFSTERVRKELADPASLFLLSVRDEDPAVLTGYAKVRAAAHESVEAIRPLALQRLYVDRPALGTGLGALLLKECIAYARSHRHDVLWLSVWEHNPRAIRFYEKWGFETVGAMPFVLGTEAQTDLLMTKPVEAED